jgi:transposase
MPHPKTRRIYIGVDTHKRTHTAVIINCFNDKLGEITFENKPSAFEELLQEVKKHTKRGIGTAYGLEDTGSSGRALAAFLIENRKTVKKVNSNYTYNERKKLPISHKTDSFDAECIAKVLLDEFDKLPDADLHDIYWTLGTFVGRRTAIVKSNTALKQQLHSYIVQHYPSYKSFFSVFDCKTGLEFWERYPSPGLIKGVSVEELREFLRVPSSGFFGEEKAKQILELVEKDGDTRTEFQESRDFLVTTCVKQIKQNNQEIGKIEVEMQKLMSQLDYRLESFIGIDLVTAAGFVSEIGDIGRFANPGKLAKYSGICPITYSSGQSDKRFKNRQGNRTLYHLFHSLAARNINRGRNKDKPVNDIFYEYYEKKISEGKTEHQALICVMRRLVNIIYGMMKNKSEYIHPELENSGDS